MIEKITPKNFHIDCEILIPGSKSISNRVLLMAGLAEGESQLFGVLYSEDTKVMAEALSELGVFIDLENIKNNGSVSIQGCAGRLPKNKAKIYTHESGTATRFLLPAVSACGVGEYYFYATPRMMERPLENQILALEALGIHFKFEDKKNSMPLFLSSDGLAEGLAEGLDKAEVLIDINQSSQFLSGLMMAGPYAKKNMSLKSVQDFTHKPYVHMTRKLMEDFGAKTEIISGHEMRIQSGSFYQGREFLIEPDMSTASYFFAIPAILGGKICIKNISRICLQGDIKFLEVLEKMGCQVLEERKNNISGICVIGPENNQKLKAIENLDMAGFSDTFMTVAVLACFADGPMTLHSLAHTRLQESDRVSAMAMGLEKLGIKTRTTPDSMTIIPPACLNNIQGARVSSFNDHRIAMSLALIGLKIPNLEIEQAEAVKKTCPDFFELLNQVI